MLNPSKIAEFAVMVFFTVGVIAPGKWILYRRRLMASLEEPASAMNMANL